MLQDWASSLLLLVDSEVGTYHGRYRHAQSFECVKSEKRGVLPCRRVTSCIP